MGKKNKKARAKTATEEAGISRQMKREMLELINQLLDKCSVPVGPAGPDWGDFLAIYDIVEKIRRIQQGMAIRHYNRDNHRAGFIEWLKNNDVDTSSVSIAKFPDAGHGLRAERPIEAGELFLQIPRKVMMTVDTAKASCLEPLVTQDRILQSMPNVVLALHLLCERCTLDSFWAPYIKILPTKYTTPLYFTPDEIQNLKGSPTLAEVVNQYRNISRQYAYFYKMFHSIPEASKLPIKDFCFDDYRWAVSTVMTRQNQIPAASGGQAVITALIPLWDMCNHADGQITTDFNLERDSSQCFALRPFKKYQQIYIFYGPRSNAELLVHNGFVYPRNQCDRLSIKLGVSKNDPLFGMKSEVLARLSMLPSRAFHLHVGDQPVDSDLIAYLRVFNMDEDSLRERLSGESASKLVAQLRDFAEFVNVEVESKAWMFLETRAALLLRAYPTTREQDEVTLKDKKIPDHVRIALQLCVCEKKILERTIVFAATQRQVVEKLPDLRQMVLDEEEEEDLDAAIAGISLSPEFAKATHSLQEQPKGPTYVQKVIVPEPQKKGPTIVELDDDGEPVIELEVESPPKKKDAQKREMKTSPTGESKVHNETQGQFEEVLETKTEKGDEQKHPADVLINKPKEQKSPGQTTEIKTQVQPVDSKETAVPKSKIGKPAQKSKQPASGTASKHTTEIKGTGKKPAVSDKGKSISGSGLKQPSGTANRQVNTTLTSPNHPVSGAVKTTHSVQKSTSAASQPAVGNTSSVEAGKVSDSTAVSVSSCEGHAGNVLTKDSESSVSSLSQPPNSSKSPQVVDMPNHAPGQQKSVPSINDQNQGPGTGPPKTSKSPPGIIPPSHVTGQSQKPPMPVTHPETSASSPAMSPMAAPQSMLDPQGFPDSIKSNQVTGQKPDIPTLVQPEKVALASSSPTQTTPQAVNKRPGIPGSLKSTNLPATVKPDESKVANSTTEQFSAPQCGSKPAAQGHPIGGPTSVKSQSVTSSQGPPELQGPISAPKGQSLVSTTSAKPVTSPQRSAGLQGPSTAGQGQPVASATSSGSQPAKSPQGPPGLQGPSTAGQGQPVASATSTGPQPAKSPQGPPGLQGPSTAGQGKPLAGATSTGPQPAKSPQRPPGLQGPGPTGQGQPVPASAVSSHPSAISSKPQPITSPQEPPGLQGPSPAGQGATSAKPVISPQGPPGLQGQSSAGQGAASGKPVISPQGPPVLQGPSPAAQGAASGKPVISPQGPPGLQGPSPAAQGVASGKPVISPQGLPGLQCPSPAAQGAASGKPVISPQGPPGLQGPSPAGQGVASAKPVISPQGPPELLSPDKRTLPASQNLPQGPPAGSPSTNQVNKPQPVVNPQGTLNAGVLQGGVLSPDSTPQAASKPQPPPGVGMPGQLTGQKPSIPSGQVSHQGSLGADLSSSLGQSDGLQGNGASSANIGVQGSVSPTEIISTPATEQMKPKIKIPSSPTIDLTRRAGPPLPGSVPDNIQTAVDSGTIKAPSDTSTHPSQ